MPPVESSRLRGIGLARAPSAPELAHGQPAPPPIRQDARAIPGLAVDVAAALVVDHAQPPIDAKRIAEIKAALLDGTYPLVPTRIADAMIAVQMRFALPPEGAR